MRRLLALLGLAVLGVAVALCVFGTSSPSTSPSLGHSSLADATVSDTSASIAAGAQLFAENCSTCHGPEAKGSALAPNLQGLGSATVDLWVSTGLMPLAVPTDQPIKKPDKFSNQQTLDIADWVQSLTPGQGVPIPSVDLKGANVSEGFDLFSANCAPCHTITGAGDALSNGIEAFPLHGLSATQVAEAIETGPGNMPRFVPGTLEPSEAKDVIAYVTEETEHPDNPGGLGLGGVGPVAEGFVGLFVGVGVCMLFAMWIGDRTEREEPNGEHGSGEEGAAHV